MLTTNDVLAALGASPLMRSVPIKDVTQDSRLVDTSSLFAALRGDHEDGHAYVGDALARGAAAVLVQRPPEAATAAIIDLRPGMPAPSAKASPPYVFVVADVLGSLQKVAAYWRQRWPVEVIGVTGSVGKTTTKEMIASVLAQRFCVLKSERNLNNEIGLPLTLLRLDETHQKAVLEMGMYDVGEIRMLCEIARPTVGVVTNVGPTHLTRLGTIERIAEAKRELVESLPPDGWAVLNGDDANVLAMARYAPGKVFTYGLGEGLDLWADEIESHGLEGIRLRLHRGAESLYLTVPLLGEHSAHTVMAAAAVGLIHGLTWEEIYAGLRVIPEQLRLVVVPGIVGSTVIDDTYNSSPASALAALNLLEGLDGRHVAVLGDMLELGSFQEVGHRKVGRRAAAIASVLVTVGELGRIISEAALDSGMKPEQVAHVADNAAAVRALTDMVRRGDFVLVKGSRGMRMEEIVQGIRG